MAHLSSDQIEELYARYLAGEKAGSLIQEYGIVTSSSNLIGLFYPIVRDDEPCPYCAIPMLQKRRSKTAREVNPIICAECSHRIESYFGLRRLCYCTSCSRIRKAQEVKKSAEERVETERVLKGFNVKPEGVELNFATVRQKFLLLALLHIQPDERSNRLWATFEYGPSLAPSPDLSNSFLAELSDAGLIKPCLENIPKNAISLLRNGAFDQLFWRLNVVSQDGTFVAVFSARTSLQLILKNDCRPYWEKDIVELVESIAIDDAMAYLRYRLRKSRVVFTAHARVREYLQLLTDRFPLTTIYALIWQACTIAETAIGANTAKSNVHAGNMIPGAMDRLSRTPKFQRDDAPRYQRPSPRMECALSIVLSAFLSEMDVLFENSMNRMRREILGPRLAIEHQQRLSQPPVSAGEIARKLISKFIASSS